MNLIRKFRFVVALAVIAGLSSCGKKEAKKTASNQPIVIEVLPPPPLPPPPPPQEPPPEEIKQEMVEETAPVDEKPAEPDAPADDPGPIGLPEGNGPGNYGPGGKGGGGTGSGSGSGQARSRFGWYAGQVQTVISEGLRRNTQTRNASFAIRVAIWADSTGRVTRAKLLGSSGNSAIDQAIQSEVLVGLQLREAPPAGMPMPIQLRLTARKPN